MHRDVATDDEGLDVFGWLAAAKKPTARLEDIVEHYHRSHPRTGFFKGLPTASAGIDLGAGDGGLSIFRRWPPPTREDIRLFAVSLEPGDFDGYEETWIGDFEDALPKFSMKSFDFVIACHFIEHIRDLPRCLRWISASLTPGGRVYLEWPHPSSKMLPPQRFLSNEGISPVIANFYDDATHVEAWDWRDVAAIGMEHDLRLVAWSQIKSQWTAEQLRDGAIHGGGSNVELTFALWTFAGFAQCLTFEKGPSTRLDVA